MSGPDAREMAALARLAATACEAAEARLAALRSQEAGLRGQIAALDEARRARGAQALAPDLALRAGADVRWEAWIDRRRTLLVSELARLLARIEIARDELRRTFGRRTATDALAAGAARDAAARRAKREERGW